MPGVATRMLPVPAGAEVVRYSARVNGEIHALEVNGLALSATRPATWAIFRPQTTPRATTEIRQSGLSERQS